MIKMPIEDKPKTVLIFADYYLPGHHAGGPIQALSNLVEHLQSEVTFKVITRNHDLGARKPYQGIESGVWTRIGTTDVYYVDGHLMPWLAHRLVKESKPAIVYMNSFLSRWYTLAPLLALRCFGPKDVKVLISPRGEFSLGALAIKPRQKSAYIAAFRTLGAFDWVTWCASSELERTDILRATQASHVRMMPNLGQKRMSAQGSDSATTIGAAARTKRSGELRLVFISRISPIKNLKGALEILAGVSVPVHFEIYGPQEDVVYWQECERLIAKLPDNIEARYLGAIPQSDVSGVMKQSDLLFLPSLGENFGYVILEALDSGCPVLLSDRTPWRNLKSEGAGWDISLSKPEEFREAIEVAWRMNSAMACRMREAARSVADRYASRSGAIDLVRQVLLEDV